MDIVDNIFRLIKENHITAKKFADDIGVSNGNVSDWKYGKSKPGVSVLPKIAEYFSVSVDFLLTGREAPPKELSPGEAEWLGLYRRLDAAGQREYRAEIKGYIKAKENTER